MTRITTLLVVSLLGASCSIGPSSGDHAEPVLAATVPAGPEVQRDEIIAGVDFSNFTYPDREEPSGITLVNGEQPVEHEGWSLSSVHAAELTGDGSDEAIVVLYMHTLGTASFFRVFIFDLSSSDSPKLLWSFWCGDRSSGGLRRIAGKDGLLTVELFGPETTPEQTFAKWKGGVPDPACCPKHFTRSTYRWDRNRFVRAQPFVVCDNPSGSLALVADERDCSSQTRQPN